MSFKAEEIYHNYSSNLPHLSNWIDELITQTENSLPISASPETILLVESIHRYDSCFRELINQVSIFSKDQSKLFGKVWVGVLNLLDYMVKLYHRHVKQTAKIQGNNSNLFLIPYLSFTKSHFFKTF